MAVRLLDQDVAWLQVTMDTVIAFAKNDGAVNLFRKQVDTVTGKTTEKIGWDTDQKSKAYAIDTLRRPLRAALGLGLDELRVFMHGERGKMGGLPGHHDDRVIALSLANVAAQQAGIGSILFGRPILAAASAAGSRTLGGAASTAVSPMFSR